MRSHPEDFETSRVANNSKSNKCKVVKSPKPLVNFKFYLDIEKHQVSLKIETKIKELGGSIEFFLTKDVTHFITDKIIEQDAGGVSSPQTPATPQTPLASNYSEISFGTPSYLAASNELKAGPKIKSRADAMLHRARKGATESADNKQTISQKSPKQIARNWGTPIWHTDHALKFLDKVYTFIKTRYADSADNSRNRHKSANTNILKGNFIKVEAFEKQYRPYYQIFKGEWPKINLNVESEAFRHPNDNNIRSSRSKSRQILCTTNQEGSKTTMTRKNRSKQIRVKQNPKLSSEKQCGFCEICRVEYDVLTIHLKTDEHVNYVKNDGNFLALDSLIKSSANVDKFLKINNKKVFDTQTCEIIPKRSKRNAVNIAHSDSNHQGIVKEELIETSIVGVNFEGVNHIRKTRQMRQPTSKRTMQERKAASESTGIVRARRESLKKINYAEPREDEENSDDTILGVSKRKKQNRSQDSKWKTASSDTHKPNKPTTTLYKVVETKTESQPTNSIDKKEPLTEKNNEQPTSLIVKFRKIRQTELSLLSGEAENFMFPKKMSSELSTDIDRQSTSDNCPVSPEIFSSEKTNLKRKSLTLGNQSGSTRDDQTANNCSNVTVDGVGASPKKRKGLQLQTRFSIRSDELSKRNSSHSMNRFPVAPIQPRGRKNWRRKRSDSNTNIPLTAKDEPQEDRMGEQQKSPSKSKSTTTATITTISSSSNTNFNNILNSSKLNEYKFAFERVPCGEPWFNVFKRQDDCQERMFEYYGSTAYRKLPYEMGPLPPMKPNCCILNRGQLQEEKTSTKEKSEEETTTDTISTKADTEKPKKRSKEIAVTKTEKQKPFNRAAALLNLDMPRKSPREHASTLAILSCLVQQKASHSEPLRGSIKKEIESDRSTASPVPHAETSDQKDTDICLQISENVKRLRRGETLARKRIEKEVETASKLSDKIRRTKKGHKKNKHMSNNDKKTLNTKDDYVDVNRLKREIDSYLSQPFDDVAELDDIPPIADHNSDINFINSVELVDLLGDDPSDSNVNVRTCNTVANNRLRLYKIFSNNKKRKNNRTGWPKKKRVITTRQQNLKIPNLNGLTGNMEIICKKEPEDVTIATQSPITPPETDPEEKVDCETVSVANRDDNTNFSNISASDKAENSDIFTVSSDSLDTVIGVDNPTKSTDSQTNRHGDQQQRLNGNINVIRKNDHCSKSKCMQEFPDKTNNLGRKAKRKSFGIWKKTNKIARVNLARVNLSKEMRKIKINSSTFLSPPQSESANTTTRSPNRSKTPMNSSPAQYSPRKLRKPRGRWYRER